MFRKEDLKSKVSQFRLGEIIEMGATDEDYDVDYTKHEKEAFRKPVRVRFDAELTNATELLLKKYKCSDNILMKSSTKLGAMLLKESGVIKTVEDVYWFFSVVYEYAQENDDLSTIYLVNTYTQKMMDTVARLKPKYLEFVLDKSVYPYPKWRLVLDKCSWKARLRKSDVYRGAIALAYGTELKLISAREFNNWFNIIARENLNTTQDFCVVFKNSAGFIKHDYATRILKRLRRKESIDDQVKKIIMEVLIQ